MARSEGHGGPLGVCFRAGESKDLAKCPWRGRYPRTRPGLNEAPEDGRRLLLAPAVLSLTVPGQAGVWQGRESVLELGSGAGRDWGGKKAGGGGRDIPFIIFFFSPKRNFSEKHEFGQGSGSQGAGPPAVPVSRCPTVPPAASPRAPPGALRMRGGGARATTSLPIGWAQPAPRAAIGW